MGLYVSDDYGLGNFDLVLVVLATISVEEYLEHNRKVAKRFCDRRQRTRPRFNESRWTLPQKER